LEQKIIKIKTKKEEIFYKIQNHKNSEGTTINKHTKQQISNIKKPEIFYELQKTKNTEGTAINKHTKKHNFK